MVMDLKSSVKSTKNITSDNANCKVSSVEENETIPAFLFFARILKTGIKSAEY
jgi:hypothetical protein